MNLLRITMGLVRVSIVTASRILNTAILPELVPQQEDDVIYKTRYSASGQFPREPPLTKADLNRRRSVTKLYTTGE